MTTPREPVPRQAPAASPQPLAECFDVALLDLDGVIYVGPRAVPGAPRALERARAMGMRLAFVTNNASRTPEDVAGHLSDLGVPARSDEVVTSAQAAATLLAARVAPGAKVLVVGGAGLHAALKERGLVPVNSADDDPEAVVQGFAPDVDWRLLLEGSLAVGRGLPWIASNTDLTIPTPRGIGPGNGALIEVISIATGRRPVSAGKPDVAMHQEALRRIGADRPLIVGDRLDTDIEGAVRAGADSLLVLTGVTGIADLLRSAPERRPTFIAEDLDGLLAPHPPVDPAPEGFQCGGWRAVVAGSQLRLAGEGSRVDALRAACAAVWCGPADVDVSQVVGRLSEPLADA